MSFEITPFEIPEWLKSSELAKQLIDNGYNIGSKKWIYSMSEPFTVEILPPETDQINNIDDFLKIMNICHLWDYQNRSNSYYPDSLYIYSLVNRKEVLSVLITKIYPDIPVEKFKYDENIDINSLKRGTNDDKILWLMYHINFGYIFMNNKKFILEELNKDRYVHIRDDYAIYQLEITPLFSFDIRQVSCENDRYNIPNHETTIAILVDGNDVFRFHIYGNFMDIFMYLLKDKGEMLKIMTDNSFFEISHMDEKIKITIKSRLDEENYHNFFIPLYFRMILNYLNYHYFYNSLLVCKDIILDTFIDEYKEKMKEGGELFNYSNGNLDIGKKNYKYERVPYIKKNNVNKINWNKSISSLIKRFSLPGEGIFYRDSTMDPNEYIIGYNFS